MRVALRHPVAPVVSAEAIGWLAMASKGAARQHRDGRWYVDFGHARRVWSFPIGGDTMPLSRDLAHRVLELVRARMSEGKSLDEAIAQFQPADAKPNLVATLVERWLELKRREVAAGDRSPTYLAELERYAAEGGHFAFWAGRSIHDVRFATLEDWSHWLADRGLSPKSRWNVLAAFRALLGWLYRRDVIHELPREYPWPKVAESEPAVLSLGAQRQVLDAIPADARGIFLALALLGLRPGEAVALRASDVRDGWLTVSRARKGAKLDAPVRGTKSGAAKRLPVPAELAQWIAVHGASRTFAAPLFANPHTGKPWAKSSLRRVWTRACERCGVSIGLYNGTKHTVATGWTAAGVDDRAIAAMLGHKPGSASTRRYARLADQALIDVLGARRGRGES